MAETGEETPDAPQGGVDRGVSASREKKDNLLVSDNASQKSQAAPRQIDQVGQAEVSNGISTERSVDGSGESAAQDDNGGGQAEEKLDPEKVDAAIAKNFGGGADLSQDDNASPPTPADNIALQESLHRTGLQARVFTVAMIVCAVLFGAAVAFGGLVLFRYWKMTGSNTIDWHVSALAAAFVLPPTVILIALIRAISYKAEDKAPSESLPALNLIKEIAVAVKEAAKAVKP